MKKRLLGLDWEEHLIYAALLLATGCFFHHKTKEQARLNDTMETVFPMSAMIITSQNNYLFSLISDQTEYLLPKSYRTRTEAIQKLIERADTDFERMERMPDAYRRKNLERLLEQFLHFPDTVLLACNSDSVTRQQLRKIFPDEFWDTVAEHLPHTKQPELVRLTNALRLRAGLAANAGLRYISSQIVKNEPPSIYVPVLTTHQPCPNVGELFEAEISLDRYFAEWNFQIIINGRRYASDKGLAQFEQRFARPGKHNLQVLLNRSDTVEEFELYHQEFEVEVWPR